MVTKAKIKLTPLPPNNKRLVCIHSATIDDSLKANLVALKYAPSACELMDDYILQATKRNPMYRALRFFVEGDPEAILVVELNGETPEEADQKVTDLISDLKSEGRGYAYPVIQENRLNPSGTSEKLDWAFFLMFLAMPKLLRLLKTQL